MCSPGRSCATDRPEHVSGSLVLVAARRTKKTRGGLLRGGGLALRTVKVAGADFVVSAADAATLPDDGQPHVAFVGRSNVGKSSLINALTRSRVARTAARPGKTRLLNLYRVALAGGRVVNLVDLPGYGYAGRAPHDFDALVGDFWDRRGEARGGTLAVLVADARHPGLDADRAAWAWLQRRGVDAVPVVNKVDKLSRADRVRHFREFERMFGAPPVEVSTLEHEGVDSLWKQIVNRLPR